MILGSEALRPMIRSLLPKAEIIGRPRFSTLSYAGPAKLSRLPPRSAIVAFSADQVYAVAEALRRMRGGAAVVMGALSPRTRNAQVAMYQAGEVDYLVATDAIGMGLNMDVAHVAFAGLGKFDGRRRRRLTPAEMAQIAGRAGRHQRDGTFGTLNIEGEALAEFRDEEVDAIENHRFAPMEFLYWREGEPDYRSVEALIRSLERRPTQAGLRAAPEAVDLAVLKSLSSDPELGAVRGERAVRRLWAACGLPDFRKTGPEQHARLAARSSPS
jgi:ATP-dependent RNA helicase SUPV3L1/SUV3